MAVEILHMRIAIQRELVLAEFQCLQQNLVIEDFRPGKVGDGDVEVVDSGDFGHLDCIGLAIELGLLKADIGERQKLTHKRHRRFPKPDTQR